MVVISWIGAFVLIVAYFMLATDRIKSDNVIYHIMNLVGSVSFIIYGYTLDAYPSVFINSVFALIAMYSIFKILYLKK